MSIHTTHGHQATDLPDDDPRDRRTLTTIVTRTLPHDELPDWEAYRTAAWAIEDTIRRVAPEAQA